MSDNSNVNVSGNKNGIFGLLKTKNINLFFKNEKTRNNGSKLSYNLFKIEVDKRNESLKVKQTSIIPDNPVVVPGSFRPVHEGHFLIGIKAYKEISKKVNLNSNKNRPIIFELSKFNRNKPSASNEDIKQRIEQFLEPNRPYINKVRNGMNKENKNYEYDFYICVTETAMFRDKIDIFGKGTSFVIGADLFVRIIKPPTKDMDGVMTVFNDLLKFKNNNCKLFVANRLKANENRLNANKKKYNNATLELNPEYFNNGVKKNYVAKNKNENSVGNFNKIINGQYNVMKSIIEDEGVNENIKSFFRNVKINNATSNLALKISESNTDENIKIFLLSLISPLLADLFYKIDDFVNVPISSSNIRKNFSTL